MSLANCSRCGILYNQTTRDICMECYQEEEELFAETQDFIRRNPMTTMDQVLEHVEVEQAMLDRWIDEKRIILHDAESVKSKTVCMYCGREISKGEHVCKTCLLKQVAMKKKESTSDLSDEESEDEPAIKSQGMHIKHFR